MTTGHTGKGNGVLATMKRNSPQNTVSPLGVNARFRLAAFVCAVSLLVGACDLIDPAPGAGVAVTPSAVEIGVGASVQLTAEVRGEEGLSQDVTWSSSDGAVATVDDVGLVIGMAPGTAEVTATSVSDATLSGSAEVTVSGEEEPDEFETLNPDGMITGVDGVTLGAPEGALDDAVEIRIGRVSDPTEETPLPSYLEHVELLGDFYEVAAASDVSTPYGQYLVLGLPVPEGAATEDLAIAALSPPGSVIQHRARDLDPSFRWRPLRGHYDEESGLFGTIVPYAGTEPRTYVLIKGADYAPVEVATDVAEPNQLGTTALIDVAATFRVECHGFGPVVAPCTPDHRRQTEEALETAYQAWVERLGFNEPRLRHVLVDLELSRPPATLTVLRQYEYGLLYDRIGGGVYYPEDAEAFTLFPGDPEEPDDLTTFHEFFHALQSGYEAFFDVGNWTRRPFAIFEGTAAAAERSVNELARVEFLDPLQVDATLFANHPGQSACQDEDGENEACLVDYRAQDFWVYLGKRLNPSDPQLSYLIPFFAQGGLLEDLQQVLEQDGTFASLGDAYWSWAKNQAFEKEVLLGTYLDDGFNLHNIPLGEPCAWSGHGDDPLDALIFDPFAPDDPLLLPDNAKDATGFSLDPLQSWVFEVTLTPDDEPYLATATVATENPAVNFKVYEAAEGGTIDCRDEERDSTEHTLQVDAERVVAYVLVSNTDLEERADQLELDLTMLELEIEPIEDQIVNEPFDVTVSLVDATGDPVPASEESEIDLTPAEGTGWLHGSLNRTLAAGESEVIFEDLVYDAEDEDVVLRAHAAWGQLEGIEATSEPFDVGGPASQWSAFDDVPSNYEFEGVWGAAEDSVYVAGSYATMLGDGGRPRLAYYNGSEWNEFHMPRHNEPWTRLADVWGTGDDNVFVVGTYIAHFNGSTWTEMASPTTHFLEGSWGTAGNDVFAVGAGGTIVHFDGNEWTEMDSPTEERLHSVWGSASDDVFAVGEEGTIMHYDGSGWSLMASPTERQLNDVWGSAGDDVFTVGRQGAILHYDGSSWSAVAAPTSENLGGVWGSSESNVFAVGSGTVLHSDGSTWSAMDVPPRDAEGRPHVLNAVWGSAADDVFAVGSSGSILRGEP